MTGSKDILEIIPNPHRLLQTFLVSSFGAESEFCRPVLLDVLSHQLNLVLEVSRSNQLVDQAFVLVFQCSDISTKTLAPIV